MRTTNYVVKTSFNQETGEIKQSLVTSENAVIVWIMNTREDFIREALIKLGWTPPPEICSGCKNEIDPDVCWCGDYIKLHTSEHSPVPVGCDCGRVKSQASTPHSTVCQHPVLDQKSDQTVVDSEPALP